MTTQIQNLYDFTYALRAHKAGDEVEVEVLRGDKTVDSESAAHRTKIAGHRSIIVQS